MAELSSINFPLQQLQEQLTDLSSRCTKLDAVIQQTENRCFVFEVHLFGKRCLTLCGYIEQINNTFSSLENAVCKNRPEILIKHECEQFIAQYHALQQLVQGLEKGEAELLYKSYSSPKEKIYQQLQKQAQYEHRLLNMIAEQEELLITSSYAQKAYIKEKIEALKIRYQKCNAFTQKLEFQLEEISDE
ncbi:primosomal replication protein [Psychromonas aquimarina]|uniref:primosomal replication protein n=1 Tax=Psychromonas aquimarina TaxID=444919 RepID=UPI00041793C1|nr:primosomal replication protein [Psychromonas aquimarina]